MTDQGGHAAAIAAQEARKQANTVWFEHPLNSHRVRVRKLGWRVAGFLVGPLAMLVAGLWANGLACLVVVVAVAFVVSDQFPSFPTWLIPIGPVWGMFTPELLERKYLRAGWRKVQPESSRGS